MSDITYKVKYEKEIYTVCVETKQELYEILESICDDNNIKFKKNKVKILETSG